MLYTPEVVALSSDDDKTPEFNPSKFEDAAKWVYEQKGYNAKMLEQEPARALITETANVFNTALDNGISVSVIPAAMEQKLREDVYLFSAFKTHQELSEVSSMLRTKKGGVKPFEQFLTDVRRVNKDYNENYLRAEYHFAVSSAQMAAKWAEYEDDGDRYNLQYRTASDERVRDAHAALHNITLPIDDPFWDKYFAPNGWGCRCNVVRVRKSKYKESDSEKALELGLAATRQMSGKIDKGAIFRFNPGKSKQVFPPKHPYYKITGKDASIIRTVAAETASAGRKIDLNKLLKGSRITEQDVKNIMLAYSEKFKENYNGGLVGVDIKRSKSAFMSNGRYIGKSGNYLAIHNFNFEIRGIKFNPYIETRDAFNAIRRNEKLTFNQEYAMESLWHETLHAKAKGWVNYNLRTKKRAMQMETINQFVARNTYPQFIESFGGKASNQKSILDDGYGYSTYVDNFRSLLKHHKISESEAVAVLSDKLLNVAYEDVGKSTISYLTEKGVANAEDCINALGRSRSSYKELFSLE